MRTQCIFHGNYFAEDYRGTQWGSGPALGIGHTTNSCIYLWIYLFIYPHLQYISLCFCCTVCYYVRCRYVLLKAPLNKMHHYYSLLLYRRSPRAHMLEGHWKLKKKKMFFCLENYKWTKKERRTNCAFLLLVDVHSARWDTDAASSQHHTPFFRRPKPSSPTAEWFRCMLLRVFQCACAQTLRYEVGQFAPRCGPAGNRW